MGTNIFTRTHLFYALSFAGALLLFILVSSFFHTKKLTIDVFDIGQGDAILITTAGGERILVDGGPDTTVVGKLARHLGFFNRTIDLLIATHPQADHITGLVSVLDRFTVKQAMLTTITNETPEYAELRRKLNERKIPIVDPGEISTLTIGTDNAATLTMLWPSRSYEGRRVDDPNDISTMFMLTYGNRRFLFTGDSTAVIEEALLQEGEGLHADVLKVGHHGSDTSTSEKFIRAVNPSIAAISVGRKNRFGHPSRRVLRRLERMGIAIYRTDIDGDIRIVSDGEGLTVK